MHFPYFETNLSTKSNSLFNQLASTSRYTLGTASELVQQPQQQLLAPQPI
jgi:hypothetical protein